MVAEVFSTITSPVFSELVIILSGREVTYLTQGVTLFETLRKMNEVRPFKLVFSLVDWDDDREGRKWMSAMAPLESNELRRGLREALDYVAGKGFLDILDPPPTARIVRCRSFDWGSRLGLGLD